MRPKTVSGIFKKNGKKYAISGIEAYCCDSCNGIVYPLYTAKKIFEFIDWKDKEVK